MISGALRPEAVAAAAGFRAFHERLAALTARLRAPVAQPPDASPIRQELAAAILALGYVQVRAPDALRIDSGCVLVAFADEMLLTECGDWANAQGWDKRPLEATLYGTALAGERVFAAAAALIEGRRDDVATATTILLALVMGMRGQWLDRDDGGALTQLRAGLYLLVTGQPYDANDPRPYRPLELQPTALTGASTRPLPALWPWLAALAAVVLLYLPVSHLVWRNQVAETDALAQAINRRAAEDTGVATNAAADNTSTPPPAPAAPPTPQAVPPAAPGLSIPGPLDVQPVDNTARNAGSER